MLTILPDLGDLGGWYYYYYCCCCYVEYSIFRAIPSLYTCSTQSTSISWTGSCLTVWFQVADSLSFLMDSLKSLTKSLPARWLNSFTESLNSLTKFLPVHWCFLCNSFSFFSSAVRPPNVDFWTHHGTHVQCAGSTLNSGTLSGTNFQPFLLILRIITRLILIITLKLTTF